VLTRSARIRSTSASEPLADGDSSSAWVAGIAAR
jgi:hypothetical protein